MRLPEIAAEASLGNLREHYDLASRPASEIRDLVQPQSYSIHRFGGLTVITVCDTGIGCVQIQVPGGTVHTQQ